MLYDQGDFNLFRQLAADCNWDCSKSEDVNQYTLHFTNKLINLPRAAFHINKLELGHKIYHGLMAQYEFIC